MNVIIIIIANFYTISAMSNHVRAEQMNFFRSFLRFTHGAEGRAGNGFRTVVFLPAWLAYRTGGMLCQRRPCTFFSCPRQLTSRTTEARSGVEQASDTVKSIRA